MKLIIGLTLALMAFSFCESDEQTVFDLAIKSVDIFDSKSKAILKQKTILINADTIAAIVEEAKNVNALRVIDGKGRLAVSGFVDTHVHLSHTFGDAEQDSDSLSDFHRQMLSETYLKYGTTTIVDMGQPSKWIKSSIEWQKHPHPNYPNLYISGGALISDQDGTLAFTHEEVANSEEARRKVQEYADIGIQHIKLYSYLDEPEFSAVVKEAKSQKLTISGHIDRGGITISDAMKLGVKNFEHIFSLTTNVIDFYGDSKLLIERYDLEGIETIDQWVAVMIFYSELIEETPKYKSNMNELLDEMAKNGATLSTTIHQLGAVAGETLFFTSFGSDSEQMLNLPNYTATHKLKLKQAFGIVMKTLKRAHDKGIKIRIGTDSRRGGEALLSELLLLYEHGFSVEDILQIATINGATAMNIDNQYGQIAKGKKADILIFEESPFSDYNNFLSKKTILKDGQVFVE